MCILSVGLLECIKREVITPDRAEQWLFSPVIAYNMKKSEYSKAFKYALEFASETDAAKKALHKEVFEQCLKENQDMFINILKKMDKSNYSDLLHLKGLLD